MKSLLLTAIAVSSSLTWASERTVVNLNENQFKNLKIESIDSSKLYYTDKVVNFPDWVNSDEYQDLALYQNYVEPTVKIKKNGLDKTQHDALVIFVGETKTVLNKPAAQIDVKRLITENEVNKFAPAFKHKPILANQLISVAVSQKKAATDPIQNFKWCNASGNYFFRSDREIDLSYINKPAGPNWCEDKEKTACYESCYVFSGKWYAAVEIYNLAVSEPKDLGIATQSELRYFTDEKDLNLVVPLKTLTGVDTPVRGGMVQSLYYFNQVFEFGKTMVVLQDDPTNPARTVMTTYEVFAIKKRSWDQFSDIPLVLMGKSRFNSADGSLTDGLPPYSKINIGKLSSELETQ